MGIIGVVFVFQYTLGGHGSFHAPAANWLIYIFLCVIPFIPFVYYWNMNKPDLIYSGCVLCLSLYALFFAYFDGRFLVLGYPIWTAYSLRTAETIVPRIKCAIQRRGKDE